MTSYYALHVNPSLSLLHFHLPFWLAWKFCGIAANYFASEILKGFQFRLRFQSILSQLVHIEIATGLSHPQKATHWQILYIYIGCIIYMAQLSPLDSLPGWTIAGLMWMLLAFKQQQRERETDIDRERGREGGGDRVITATKQTQISCSLLYIALIATLIYSYHSLSQPPCRVLSMCVSVWGIV